MILRLTHVCKSYERPRGQKVALDRVSLELARGQIMGIFGPSGAGKTTLLRIAAGFEMPDSGVVAYDGEHLGQMSAAQLRRHRRRNVGCVWAREPWTPGLSVIEHIELPLLIDGCERRAARRTASKFSLACEVERYANMSLEELSDGERQRVAIARALVIEPRLLLIDGAISGLSIVEQEATMALLASLASEAKVAVLIADTGAGELLQADPVLYLRDGRLITSAQADRAGGRLYTLPSVKSHRAAADA